jgi:FMN phosphatase YigB (HAD superfamily)
MKNNFDPKLVVFDLYGTLVKFGIMHHPFRELLKWARANGRSANENDARTLMTINKDLPGLALDLGVQVPQIMLDVLTRNIQQELASLSLFDDVVPTLNRLQQLGIPMAVCSNLARPYGVVIDQLLPEFQLHRFLSYEVGFIKPEPEMYQTIGRRLNIPPKDCLFIGDTFIADYEGPIKNGFQARHLVRRHGVVEPHALYSLQDLFIFFDMP